MTVAMPPFTRPLTAAAITMPVVRDPHSQVILAHAGQRQGDGIDVGHARDRGEHQHTGLAQPDLQGLAEQHYQRQQRAECNRHFDLQWIAEGRRRIGIRGRIDHQ